MDSKRIDNPDNRLYLNSQCKSDFRAPEPDSRLIRILQHPAVSRSLLRMAFGNVQRVEYDPENLKRFESVRNESVLVTPNHIHRGDGGVMFDLSAKLRTQFHTLANRELFGRSGGWYGSFLQKTGAYSIARGLDDRDSRDCTINLLSSGPNKVVIFPEGGIYGTCDEPFLFQEGVFSLANKAYRSAGKSGTARDVYVLPVAIKYSLAAQRGTEGEIQASFRRLEDATGVPDGNGLDYPRRLLAIAHRILTMAEDRYGIASKSDDANARLQVVKAEMLDRLERRLSKVFPKRAIGAADATWEQRCQSILNRSYSLSFYGRCPRTDYGRKLDDEVFEEMLMFYRHFSRFTNWMSAKFGYNSERPYDLDRVIDVLRRMEKEVGCERRIKVGLVCKVRLGEPISIAQCVENDGPRGTRKLSALVRNDIRELLLSM